jgi:voltage-gated potassium channel
VEFRTRRFVYAVLAFACVLAIGTTAFQAMLGEGWTSSFYRAVVTTTLTGLDTKPGGADAEIFTIVLLLAGVAIFLYIAGSIADVIARGVLGGTLGERRRRRAIERVRNHVIICGYGRVGRRAGAEFRAAGMPYVVVDVNEDSVAAAQADGAHVIHGDGTEDSDLFAAGLEHARGLIASVDSDEKNLFITLSARAARPDLAIVARASNESTARKLERAGANRVVQLYSTAGLHMANLVLKPQVADFLDIVTTHGGPVPELRFEEIVVTRECGQCGRSMRELRIQDVTGGALVIALRKADGTFDVTPGPDAVFDEGDVVIGVGTTEEMRRLEDLFAPREAVVG